MRVLQINSVNFGSTGSIARGIAAVCRDAGMEAYLAFPESRSNSLRRTARDIVIGNRVSRNVHIQAGFVTGMQGTFSRRSTKQFLDVVKDLNPDVLHLHNLHDCYLNLPMLFEFIKATSTQVVWTLHDCWPLTGKCTHYTAIGCEKWIGSCRECPQLREYPAALVDRTERMHGLKKAWFSSVRNMVLVTPSDWLRRQVERSYLREYDVLVINNGIQLDVFRPTSGDFRRRHRLGEKKIVLGVADGWSDRKGLGSLLDLRSRLGSQYEVVIVGLSSDQMRQMPTGVVGMRRTDDAYQLAEIYSAADVFFNPTREDNYPTVNLEALACGTPVVTFRVGGAAEMIKDDCGRAVEPGDLSAAARAIAEFTRGDHTSSCVESVSRHGRDEMFRKYVSLYAKLVAN